MRLLRYPTAVVLLLLFTFSEVKAQKDVSATFLSQLEGVWSTDTGKSFGLPAVVNMTCTKTLGAKFLELSYKMEMSGPDGKKQVFEGRAFYKPAPENQFVGTWFDTGGEMHPLKASNDSTALTSIWGTAETKLGKTLYILSGSDTVEIIDFIMKKDGNWKEFNRNTLIKKN